MKETICNLKFVNYMAKNKSWKKKNQFKLTLKHESPAWLSISPDLSLYKDSLLLIYQMYTNLVDLKKKLSRSGREIKAFW